MSKLKRKKKLPRNKNYIPFDTTKVSICSDCGEQVICCYSLGKSLKFKVLNTDKTAHKCRVTIV